MPDLDDIVKAVLPKKYRKKLKKKKVLPLLLEIVSAFVRYLLGNNKQARSAPKRPLSPMKSKTNKKPVASAALLPYLEQAAAYTTGIRTLSQRADNQFEHQRLQELATNVAHWQAMLQNLAQRVDEFHSSELLQRDLKAVPKSIARLQKQLENEKDSMVQAEIARTLRNRQTQWASLEKLQRTMQLAEVKMESTVSMLGTIYSQAHIGRSRGQVASYRRLLDEVNEEVMGLQDYLAAMDEVKFGTGPPFA